MRVLIIFVIIQAVNIIELDAQNLNQSDQESHLILLDSFLSIPNNGQYLDHIEQNIDWLSEEFKNLGFTIHLLESKGNPLFYAERKFNQNLPTVLFYMHFDGQPVDSTQWDQKNPYDPVYKRKSESGNWQLISNDLPKPPYNENWRVFARSASDDKGPIVMLLAALHEIEDEFLTPKFNIKVILDSEEELGSPNLLDVVQSYNTMLKSDYLVVADGPMHDSGNPTLKFGNRGITTISMEIYGPNFSQHSGHYGNYAPNPVFRAANLLSTMKDANGRVIIPGFYDNVRLGKVALMELSKVPDKEEDIRNRAGFAIPEKVGSNYQEAMQYPSLNVRGIRAGWVGSEARTIVPDKVTIEMDIRTVPETDGESLVNHVKTHVSDQGFTILNKPPSLHQMLEIEKPLFFKYKVLMYPFRTQMDSDLGHWLSESLQKAHQKEVIKIRISGGSLPLSFIINELEIPAVLVPLVNPDNNQHSPNENLRIGNYFDGIHSLKTILLNPIIID